MSAAKAFELLELLLGTDTTVSELQRALSELGARRGRRVVLRCTLERGRR
jgi:hypothetical protein